MSTNGMTSWAVDLKMSARSILSRGRKSFSSSWASLSGSDGTFSKPARKRLSSTMTSLRIRVARKRKAIDRY